MASRSVTEKEFNEPGQAGRKPLPYASLKDATKDKKSRELAEEPLDKLLRAAEKVASHSISPGKSKLLELIRKNDDSWATQTLKDITIAKNLQQPAAVEDCLFLKTRQGLSKRKYQGIAKFLREKMGSKVLQPWKVIMEYRNNIIPAISTPNWSEGYLSVSVTLRDMVTANVSRMLDLDDVKTMVEKLICDSKNGIVECELHIAAGVDSATGFSHYDQAGILHHDESLLSEHVMSLCLVSNGSQIWLNPNPQSDTFCQPRSMSWVKEVDFLTKDIFDAFYGEVDIINNNPVVIPTGYGELSIKVKANYSLIDGKAANAIVDNRNTHLCPICVAKDDDRVGGTFFHNQLNGVEWLFRVSSQKQVEDHPAQAHPEVRCKAREAADAAEKSFHMAINRAKIGGCGTSNSGNTARNLLAKSAEFARILSISPTLVENFRLISSLALSSHKLNSQKVAELYSTFESQLWEEFPFIKKIPPCLHKYSHLPEYINRSVILSEFVSFQL